MASGTHSGAVSEQGGLPPGSRPHLPSLDFLLQCSLHRVAVGTNGVRALNKARYPTHLHPTAARGLKLLGRGPPGSEGSASAPDRQG